MDRTREMKIVRMSDKGVEERSDLLVREVPLTVMAGGQEIATLLCTPDRPEHLAVGFLLSEGVVSRKEDIADITAGANGTYVDVTLTNDFKVDSSFFQKRLIGSGCGKSLSFYNRQDIADCTPVSDGLTVAFGQVMEWMSLFQKRSELFRETGGVHSAALCSPSESELFAEDIGRHNAVDKLFGQCLMEGIAVSDRVLLTSGRVSSEILIKALRRGLEIVVSRSAPTDLAVGLADKMNLTLVGFARGARMNIYTRSSRIVR